jgi:hypothetical protein
VRQTDARVGLVSGGVSERREWEQRSTYEDEAQHFNDHKIYHKKHENKGHSNGPNDVPQWQSYFI